MIENDQPNQTDDNEIISFEDFVAQQEGEPEETLQEAQEEQQTVEDPEIEIDGEKIPLSALKQQRMLHADYTRKTQELAELRRKLNHWEQAEQALQVNPEAAIPLIAKAFDPYGVEVAPKGARKAVQEPEPDLEDMTPNELALYRQNKALEAQMSKVTGALSQVTEHLQTQRQREAQSLAIKQAVSTLSTDYGVKATPDQIEAAMLQTGLNDPEAAVLKAYGKQLFQAKQKQGIEAAKVQKPNSVSTKGNSVDLSDESDPDAIFAALASGAVTLPEG